MCIHTAIAPGHSFEAKPTICEKRRGEPPSRAWAHVGGARSFLLLPLSEILDEHYTVYFCLGDRLAAGRQMPRFCT